MTTSSLPSPLVHAIFDPATWTVTYVVHLGRGSAAALIDPVLDYDPKSGRTSHTSADKVVDYVRALDLRIEWILETHAHADHLSAVDYLKSQLGGKTGVGVHITQVQRVFKCRVSCDHIPRRSWALFRARDLMRGVMESFKTEHAV